MKPCLPDSTRDKERWMFLTGWRLFWSAQSILRKNTRIEHRCNRKTRMGCLPGRTDPQHEARDLYRDGVAAALKGDRATAERLFRASLALEPQDHRAWLWLAGVVASPEESIEHLEHVLGLAPNDPHALAGIQWARHKLTVFHSAGAQDASASLAERRSISTIVGRMMPINARWLPLIWIALASAVILVLLASAAVLSPGGGFPLSLVRQAGGVTPEPPFAFTAVAGTNAPASVRAVTPTPTPIPSSPEPVLSTAAPKETIAFKPTTQAWDTEPSVVTAAATAVLLPSTATTLQVEGLLLQEEDVALNQPESTSSAIQPVEAPSFLPRWYPAVSPMSALRRSAWPGATTTRDKIPEKPQPETSGAEKWIEVDIGEQTLRAFEGDQLIMEFTVSTGPQNAPTVEGEFRVLSKFSAIDMAGPGYFVPAVPYTMFFYDGYAIHGAYWHNRFGQPTGHGCVNMRPDEARRIFDWSDPVLPFGTYSVQATADNQGTLVVVHQ